jgi:hypothetical protein
MREKRVLPVSRLKREKAHGWAIGRYGPTIGISVIVLNFFFYLSE